MSTVSGAGPYHGVIQEGLNKYSESLASLKKAVGTIGENRTTTADALKNETLKNNTLKVHYTSQKVSEAAKEIYDTLKMAHKRCPTGEIPEESYEILAFLGEPVAKTSTKEKSLRIVRDHLNKLANGVDDLIKTINLELSTTAKVLDGLFYQIENKGALKPAPWVWYGENPTTDLDKALNLWKETHPDELGGEGWRQPILEETTSPTPLPSDMERLNNALAVLNLIYIDPLTRVKYGEQEIVAAKQEDPLPTIEIETDSNLGSVVVDFYPPTDFANDADDEGQVGGVDPTSTPCTLSEKSPKLTSAYRTEAGLEEVPPFEVDFNSLNKEPAQEPTSGERGDDERSITATSSNPFIGPHQETERTFFDPLLNTKPVEETEETASVKASAPLSKRQQKKQERAHAALTDEMRAAAKRLKMDREFPPLKSAV